MAKWSGVGIPPTRKKLHRLRAKQVLEAKADRKADRQEAASLDASYRHIRRAVINPERFEDLWCQRTTREVLRELTQEGQKLGLGY